METRAHALSRPFYFVHFISSGKITSRARTCSWGRRFRWTNKPYQLSLGTSFFRLFLFYLGVAIINMRTCEATRRSSSLNCKLSDSDSLKKFFFSSFSCFLSLLGKDKIPVWHSKCFDEIHKY